jgi:hypothetical protein
MQSTQVALDGKSELLQLVYSVLLANHVQIEGDTVYAAVHLPDAERDSRLPHVLFTACLAKLQEAGVYTTIVTDQVGEVRLH